jgi:SagB-type dehydrogenase family enzyme
MDKKFEESELISASLKDCFWGWDVLSKIFHFGTKIRQADISHQIVDDPKRFVLEHIFLAESALKNSPDIYTEKVGVTHTLPPPDFSMLNSVEFLHILKKRKTSRSFDNISLSIDILSTLLYIVFGDFHPVNHEDYTKYGFQQIGLRKSSPSAGGLHSSEAYILALNIKNLEPGIYHYQAHKHILSLIRKVDLSVELSNLLCGQYFAQGLSLGIFITSRFDKIWHKYPHSRAYRVALLDIGHLSQTFQLTATALGLNTWLSGAFVDSEVTRLLDLKDDGSEQPLFFVGAGFGDGSPLDLIAKSWGQHNES